ncbi:MAG: glycerol-3-phosphate dehydrogenase/oxidase [Acidimicrobiia bacterium]
MERSSSLNPQQRQSDLSRMASEFFDVVVVGGGVTGCGVALDAVSRGLSVALVEQRDLASGTSSRSSKLIHGGLRYLEQLNFGLVREALSERNLMLNRLCPHLVEPVSFLYPLQHRFWERIYVGAGILLYDILARFAKNPLPRHRHLSRRAALELSPGLKRSSLTGAVKYWDAMVDDARHTVALARTAVSRGALVATSSRVTGMLMEEGRVGGVVVRDLEGGRELTIRARSVISATGVWTDDLQELAGDHGIDVVASKGVHLVIPRSKIESDTGLILRTEKSVLFVIPWPDHWIIGTTDTPWRLRRAHPAASSTDIEYLLDRVNAALVKPISHEDVVGVYAGLRPLLTGESEETSRLSREHAVLESESGLISVAGGKYTTYRVMARDAVDAALRRMEKNVPGSTTDRIILVGAERSGELERLCAERPDLGARLGDSRFTRAEALYAVTDEGALHLDDILTRRTRISVETADRGTMVADEVARLVAPELGWSDQDVKREVAHYLARVQAERDSQTRPDDRTADAARMGAADVRLGGLD